MSRSAATVRDSTNQSLAAARRRSNVGWGACRGRTVTFALPPGLEYLPGSVTFTDEAFCDPSIA